MASDNINSCVPQSFGFVMMTSHNDRQSYELYICTWTENSPRTLDHMVLGWHHPFFPGRLFESAMKPGLYFEEIRPSQRHGCRHRKSCTWSEGLSGQCAHICFGLILDLSPKYGLSPLTGLIDVLKAQFMRP